MAISDGFMPAIVLATVAVNAAAVDGWLFHWLEDTPCRGCSTVKYPVTAIEFMDGGKDSGELVTVIGLGRCKMGWADGGSSN